MTLHSAIVHLTIMCALILLSAIAATFFSLQPVAHGFHHHKNPKCTQLWVYTEPVQKGPCVVFQHPSGHELEKANSANIEFNKGVEAGHLTKYTCPSGNSKEFCSGWQSATQQLTSRHNNTITIIPSYYRQVSVFCMPVRLASLVWYNWCIW